MMASYKSDLDDATQEGKRAAQNAEGAAEALQGAAQGAARTVRQKAGEAQETVYQKAGEARDAVKSAANDATAYGQEAVDAMRESVSSIGDALKQTIERQPIAAVAVAALIGFVVGVANRR
jgi:ElaB/YqjD/DUF883 family membrane-anchored ribosome-binding protein